jgi:hypothetical protein
LRWSQKSGTCGPRPAGRGPDRRQEGEIKIRVSAVHLRYTGWPTTDRVLARGYVGGETLQVNLFRVRQYPEPLVKVVGVGPWVAHQMDARASQNEGRRRQRRASGRIARLGQTYLKSARSSECARRATGGRPASGVTTARLNGGGSHSVSKQRAGVNAGPSPRTLESSVRPCAVKLAPPEVLFALVRSRGLTDA